VLTPLTYLQPAPVLFQTNQRHPVRDEGRHRLH
jgi:hypothetical protein